MRKRLLIALAASVPVLGVAGYAMAGGQSDLADLRQATAKYHDLEVAKAAGYTVELPQTAAFGGGTCIANGAEGAMGIHMLSPGRVDGNLDAADPEALLYERRNNGTLKLTGVEYIVAGGSQPTLYGQLFADTNLARYGDPATNLWTLHAWVWKPNPSGILMPWNPNVSCD
jgi:hypothetical protein